MATIEPNLAGMASVHGCIGAVDPLRTFGNSEQKERYLPKLASGERLSAFALTEPGAGSDLTALKTQAVLDGDDYVVNGEKLFITNAVPGRTIGLVCLIDKRPAVLIVDLPDHEDEHFQLVTYGLLALRHLNNHGLRFKDFRVPRENLLQPAQGDGLTIAYHGLNLGRVALCATAAGSMRVMLANMLPWAKFRRTYAAPIVSRELVQRRIGRMAALIVGLRCPGRLVLVAARPGVPGRAGVHHRQDLRQRGPERSRRRAFHEDARRPRVLEGPPVRRQHPRISGPVHLRRRRRDAGHGVFQVADQGIWQAVLRADRPRDPGVGDQEAQPDEPGPRVGAAIGARAIRQVAGRPDADPRSRAEFERRSVPPTLAAHAQFAVEGLERGRLEIADVMTKHQLRLADRQCRMAELSQRLQDMVVILATSLWASRQSSELVQSAADILCQDLTRKITGKRPTDAYFRAVTKLGEKVAERRVRGHRGHRGRGNPHALQGLIA